MAITPRDIDGKYSAYAWPGGYPVFYLLADNAVICPACANRENGSEASEAVGTDDQWRIVAADINWEDADLTCEHCNTRIESAYAEDGRT